MAVFINCRIWRSMWRRVHHTIRHNVWAASGGNTNRQLSINIGYITSRIIGVLLIFFVFCRCESTKKDPPVVFVSQAPGNPSFKEELQYMDQTAKLKTAERGEIEKDLDRVEQSLGVPKVLLWCVLFQESRFDVFKNALNRLPAKGLGQFTQVALEEVNESTNQFYGKTSAVFKDNLHPSLLPIDFKLKLKHRIKKSGSNKRLWSLQSIHSYYHVSTAIFASASYLNNRYHEIKLSLDRQGIHYDPQILWIYAAAAYNKGSRTVFSLLTHAYLDHGEEALAELLRNPKAAYALLTHSERLEVSLREIWPKKIRKRYIEELQKNMEVISSCSLSGASL